MIESKRLQSVIASNPSYVASEYRRFIDTGTCNSIFNNYFQSLGKSEKIYNEDELLRQLEVIFFQQKVSSSSPALDFFRRFNSYIFNSGYFIPADKKYINALGQYKNIPNFKVLQSAYCGAIGFDFMHLDDPDEVDFFIDYIENKKFFQRELDKKEVLQLLNALYQSVYCEDILGKKFSGTKRFSLSGLDALIPMIKTLLYDADQCGYDCVYLAMPHRGRLNMMYNIFDIGFPLLKKLFEEKDAAGNVLKDVKYHLGMHIIFGSHLKVILNHNASHLESINPINAGMVRASQDKKLLAFGIQIHGDASFSGQGVVAETLNFSATQHYSTGGIIHIIGNNQIGFTEGRIRHLRSTYHASDLVKGYNIPVLHINAEYPEQAYLAVKFAFIWRKKFQRDIVLNLIGYRKYGHQEVDEPSGTQPAMYDKIRDMQDVYCRYKDIADKTRLYEHNQHQAFKHAYKAGFELISLKKTQRDLYCIQNDNFLSFEKKARHYQELDLRALAKKIVTYPLEFVLQRQVATLYDKRKHMASGNLPMDWGFCEILAYASLLHEGISLRFSGEDVERGTFSHRHAIIHDIKKYDTYTPLESCKQSKTVRLAFVNSSLSEFATLGFEYGYASASEDTAVKWEAQFGDFANGAQIIFDQYISSGEIKWNFQSPLIVFLPHGEEGQGPEHSSARIERLLELYAQENIAIYLPTKPAQMYHVLRLIIGNKIKKPQIILTPKSLLRHPQCVSSYKDLTNEKFSPVLLHALPSKKAHRVIITAGKIYYSLLKSEYNDDASIIISIEQIAPFPTKECKKILEIARNINDWVIAQDEPKNQGYFNYMHTIFQEIFPEKMIRYAGPDAYPAPALGSSFASAQQRKMIEKNIFQIKS